MIAMVPKFTGLLLSVLLATAACGGKDDDDGADNGSGSLTALCNELSDVTCDRLYECFSDQELAAVGFPASITACKSQLRDENGCDAATAEDACEGNETFHSDAARDCSRQMKTASCNQITSGDEYAPACGMVCTVD